MKVYIRFTDDINRDIEKGTSSNIFTDEGFDGLCAYSCEFNPYEEDEISAGIKRAKELAGWNAQTYADHYNGNFAILEGDYVEQGLDGVIIKNAEVIYEGNIND